MAKRYYQFQLVSGRGMDLQAPLECGLVEFRSVDDNGNPVVYETCYRPDITRLTGRGAAGEFKWVGTVFRNDEGRLCTEEGDLLEPLPDLQPDEPETSGPRSVFENTD